jgi:hypothetical protein
VTVGVRDELVGAALFYARAMSWPVTPLTFLVAGEPGCSCGRRRCDRPSAHPADAPISDVDAVIKCWSRAPFNIGLPIGPDVDAVEVEADTGVALLRRLRSLAIPPGPVLAAKDRYQFLVHLNPRRIVEPFRRELAGLDQLLVLPPSRLPSGDVQWVVEPDAARRCLPDAMDLLAVLALLPTETV